jgi:isopentenyl-diphosphate delta-isomerase
MDVIRTSRYAFCVSRIPVVDENDKLIRYKERSDRSPEDIYRVSALWLTNSKGEILIARRALNKKHNPGQWGPAVAGTVDEGEDYYQNIVKETEEEIDLTDVRFEEGPKKRVKGEKYNYFCQWYFAKSDKAAEEFSIARDEVEEVVWISKEDLSHKIKETPENFLHNMGEWISLFS